LKKFGITVSIDRVAKSKNSVHSGCSVQAASKCKEVFTLEPWVSDASSLNRQLQSLESLRNELGIRFEELHQKLHFCPAKSSSNAHIKPNGSHHQVSPGDAESAFAASLSKPKLEGLKFHCRAWLGACSRCPGERQMCRCPTLQLGR
jgi:hypothetical protein